MSLRKILYYFFIVILLLAGLVLLGSAFPFTHYKFLIVSSGSMAPVIKQGSIIMATAMKDYHKGDVIVFFYASDKKRLITHRIYAVEMRDNKTFYITKGDANKGADLSSIIENEILGRVVFKIP